MAHVIDLKPKPVAPKPEPVVLPEPIPHPIVQEQKILTDSGEKVPFETIRWTAPAFYRREGTRAPYIFAAALLVAAVLVAIFQRDLITTILFGLFGAMMIVHTRHGVPAVDVEVSPLGIKRGTVTYRYQDIKSFWVHYEPEYDIRELSLHLKKWSSPYVKIQLGAEDPVQIYRILIQFIPEVQHEETGIHTLVRWIGI